MATITQGPGGDRPRLHPSWLLIQNEATRLMFEGHFPHRFTSRVEVYVDEILLELEADQVRCLRDWLTEWLDRKEEVSDDT